MERPGEIESRRFLWVAALTVVVSVAAVLVVRAAALGVVHPSARFEPLAVGPPILDTVVCVIVAIFVFLKIAPNSDGVKAWRYVATVVLIVSFLPDVLIARSHEMEGGWPEARVLMAMHVVVWVVCITLLPGLAYSIPAATKERGGGGLSIL
jgi:hypothetical protein